MVLGISTINRSNATFMYILPPILLYPIFIYTCQQNERCVYYHARGPFALACLTTRFKSNFGLCAEIVRLAITDLRAYVTAQT